jgi:hypothetical protein
MANNNSASPYNWTDAKLTAELKQIETTLVVERSDLAKARQAIDDNTGRKNSLFTSTGQNYGDFIKSQELKISSTNDRILTLQTAKDLYQKILKDRAVNKPKNPPIKPVLAAVNENLQEIRPPQPLLVTLPVVNINVDVTPGVIEYDQEGNPFKVITDDDGSQVLYDASGNFIGAVSAYKDADTTSVSTVAYGNYQNTIIATANKNRMHACDTTLFVQRNKAMAIIAEQLVRGIRLAVKAILSALGISPGASGIAQYIKQIKGWIEDITDFLTKINEGIAKYALIVAKIGALIQYLSNLPAELLAYFKKCILELYNELKKQFMDAVQQGVAAGVADYNAELATEQALDAQIASESTIGLDVVQYDDGSTLITNEDGTFTATDAPIDKIDANIGKEFSSLLDSTKTLAKTASATAANITSLPAKTLSALTNPTASSTPLTSAQASSLSKEVFGDILPTTKYEAA